MNKNKKNPEDRELGYKLFMPVFNKFFKFYFNPKTIGKENIPSDGAIVIAGNHKHILDQCITIANTKRMIHYMAKKEYFEGKFAWFFGAMGCIPVDRQNTDIRSVKSAMKVLRKGGAIGIFPEGTRNRTDVFLLEFKPGAVSLAKKTDAYLVPFGITGDYKFRSKNLTIRYGKPFKVTDMTTEQANEKLYREVERLMLEGTEEKNLKVS